MLRIRAVLLAASAATALCLPVSALAHSDSHGFAFGNDGDFDWAIVSDNNTSMSGQFDPGVLEDLKDRFGSHFLMIEDHRERYVITDRELFERAQRASQRIGRYGREIGEIARAQASLAMEKSRPKVKAAKLRVKQRELERKIDRAEREGEPTDDLERELEDVTIRLEATESASRSFARTDDERENLKRRRDDAKVRLHREVEKINDEMRDILRSAKTRRLAERVD